MILRITIVLVMLVLPASAQSGKHVNKTLESLIERAVEVSPKLKMLKSKLKIANYAIEKNTNLPDPTLSLGFTNLPENSFSFTQEPMTAKIIGISQSIPFPGKLKTAERMKAVDTLIVKEEIKDLINQIGKDVSLLYFDLCFVREKIKLINESISLLEQISEVVKNNYKVSKATLQNVIQVEVQITRTNDKLEILKSKESSIISELNAILIRNKNTSILTDAISVVNGGVYSVSRLLQIAIKNRPFLRGIKYSEEKFKFKENLASYSFYPDFKIALQYSQRDYSMLTGTDFKDLFSVMLGITLPLNYGGKNTAAVKEAEYMQAFSRDNYNYAIQRLNQAFAKITSRLNEYRQRENLICNKLLPQVKQAYKAALSDYQANKIDFVNVIAAEEEILKVKTELLQIRIEFRKKITELEFLTGKKLK